MDSLKKGDKIYCYLIETASKYECVEIKSDEMILSLDKYNQIYSKQGLIGIVLCQSSFLFVLYFNKIFARILE